jgi:hypothetical protein
MKASSTDVHIPYVFVVFEVLRNGVSQFSQLVTSSSSYKPYQFIIKNEIKIKSFKRINSLISYQNRKKGLPNEIIIGHTFF